MSTWRCIEEGFFIMEIWKEIDGYNGVYFVSNLGQVKSIDHYCSNRTGSGKQTGRVFKIQVSYKGYLRVALSKNKKKFHTSVHRLIAKAFIPNPENKPQVNHINGIKSDNRIENLEWCTNGENMTHAFKNNLVNLNYGEKHHNSKLSNDDVLRVRKLHSLGFTCKSLAEDYNVSQTAMSKILRNITYKNSKIS